MKLPLLLFRCVVGKTAIFAVSFLAAKRMESSVEGLSTFSSAKPLRGWNASTVFSMIKMTDIVQMWLNGGTGLHRIA